MRVKFLIVDGGVSTRHGTWLAHAVPGALRCDGAVADSDLSKSEKGGHRSAAALVVPARVG